MYYYQLFQLTIQSDVPILQLLPADDTDHPDIIIEAGNIPEDIIEKESQNIYYEFGDARSWLVNNYVRLLMEHGNHITYFKKDGCPDMYLTNYLLGWGMSMTCLQRNMLAMHCSVVTDDEKAYLISGESGSGKSTVTRELLHNGYKLMADDMTLVNLKEEKVLVTPAFPYQKLCRDAAMHCGKPMEELIYIDEAKDKFLVPCHEIFENKELPIGGLIILYRHPNEDVVFQNVEGFNKLHAFANNLFLRHLLQQKKYDPKLGSIMLKMASKTPICTIGRPDDKDTVPEILTYVSDFIKQNSQDE